MHNSLYKKNRKFTESTPRNHMKNL